LDVRAHTRVLPIAALIACTHHDSITWTGTSGGPGVKPTLLRLQLQTKTSTSITGSLSLAFTSTAAFVPIENVSGTRNGNTVHLQGDYGVALDGRISGKTMTGSITFPQEADETAPYVSPFEVNAP
jgi:hypothetical protein